MATTAEYDKNDERRKRVFVGTLPQDFLRIDTSRTLTEQERQEAADEQAAISLQQQQLVNVPYTNNSIGTLKLTIVQAKLVKNYGLVRMDPYVRLRVGHGIYETNSDANGGRTPKWNRDVQCLLPHGVTSISIEIFDECSFTMDELIAWTQIAIPGNVLKGETIEDWYPLSGKQGDGLEGMINVVLSYSPTPQGGYYPAVGVTPVLALPYGFHTYRQVPAAFGPPALPPVASVPPPPQPSAEDLKLIEDMFPNMDKEVIRSVYEVNRFKKDLTVNSLLQMVD